MFYLEMPAQPALPLAPLPSEGVDKRDLGLWGCKEGLPKTNSKASRVQHQTPQADLSLKISSLIT